MTILDRTIQFLNKYGVTPQKRFSQNFLIDPKSITSIINCIDTSNIDQIIEIGPGLGSLTFELLKLNKPVTAIEFDNDMIKVLKNEISDSNFALKQNDFLKEDLTKYHHQKIAYVGNLPYQITRNLIKKILTDGHFFSFSFMLEKDLANQMFYKKGNFENNVYSAMFAIIGKLTKVIDLAPKCFYPSPKVDSSFLNFIPLNFELANEETFKILDVIFKNNKKTLLNNLKNSYLKEAGNMFENLNISLSIRAHQLDINEIINIVNYYKVNYNKIV